MIRIVLLAAVLLAVPNPAAAASRFGFSSAARSKVGDGYDMPLYGGGRKSLVRVGTQLYVSYTTSHSQLSNGFGDAVLLGLSVDGGANWLKNVVIAKGLNDGYAAPVAVGPHPTNAGWSRLHVAWVGAEAWPSQEAWYAYVDVNPAAGVNAIQGSSAPIAVGTVGGGAAGNVTVGADATGGVHVAYVGPNDAVIGASPILYSRSGDYGATFGEQGTLVANWQQAGCTQPWNVQFPSLTATPAGDIFVVGSACNFVVARRLAGEGAFSPPVTLPAGLSAEPALVATDANNAWVVAAAQTSFAIARTSNGGQLTSDWNVSYGPAVSGTSPFNPSIAVDSTGVVNVAWVNYPTHGYFTRSNSAMTSWSAPVVFATSLGSDLWDPSLTLDGVGKANIAFDDMGVVFFTKEQ